MEAVLAKSHGGRDDDDALLEFRRMCWAALLLMDDSEARADRQPGAAREGPVFRGRKPRRREPPGSIRSALGALRGRLQAIEGGYGKRWRDLRAA